MPDVTLLQRPDSIDASGVLARAFADSPVYAAVLTDKNEAARLKTLTRVKAGFVSATVGHRESRVVREGDRVVGVSLVMAPGGYPLSWADEIRQSTGCATTGPTAILRFLKLTAYMRKRHEPRPHFYLFAIAVDPSRQGRGIGKALLRELHARADAAAAPCYLETEKAINVKLYESQGYRVVTDENIPGFDSLRMWTMRRPAPGDG